MVHFRNIFFALLVAASVWGAEPRPLRPGPQCAALLKFVGDETTAHIAAPQGPLSSTRELEDRFGVSRRQLTIWLKQFLPADHLVHREHHLRGAEGSRRGAQARRDASAPQVVALNALARAELEDFKAQRVTALLTVKELGARFEKSGAWVYNNLEPALRTERTKLTRQQGAAKSLTLRFGTGDSREAKEQEIRDVVAAELVEYRAASRKFLSSNAELGERFGGKDVGTISRILAPLGKPLTSYRQNELQRDRASRELELRVLALVRFELERRKIDPAAKVSTLEELIAAHGASESTLSRWLRSGLTAEEKNHRQRWINDQRSTRSRNSQNQRRIHWNGIFYDSFREAAMAFILETYVRDFQIRRTENFHVDRGAMEIDFIVEGTYLEYHPIVLTHPRGDFKSQEEFDRFSAALKALPTGADRTLLRQEKTRALLGRYTNERRTKIAALAELEEKEPPPLVVITTPQELHTWLSALPLDRQAKPIPDAKTLSRQFDELVDRVKREGKSSADR